MKINVKKSVTYLKVIFILPIIFLQFHCSYGQLYSGDNDIILILNDNSNKESRVIGNELSKVFEYTKIPIKKVDLSVTHDIEEIPPSTHAICITTPDNTGLSEASIIKIVQFVAQGGTIVFTCLCWDQRMFFLQGIEKIQETNKLQSATNWYFETSVLHNMKHKYLHFQDIGKHSGPGINAFKAGVRVLAYAEDKKDYPVLIQNKIGKGYVFIYNTSILNDRFYRGLLFSTTLQGLEGIPYPIANISAIDIDDFPMPLYNTKIFPISDEYNKTQAEWVTENWWPDIAALADTFNLKYTTYAAFNYNGKTKPPFDFSMWEYSKSNIHGQLINSSAWLARQVINSRHELGLHGYNHESLNIKEWFNPNYIITALQAVRKQWKIDGLGRLPVAYVPPTNDIDSTGLQMLIEGMPSLKYMCSLYLGDKENGEQREFDVDPYNKNFFNFPRITSGYIYSDELFFKQENLYIYSGIWHHFIHPDDVFQGYDELTSSEHSDYESRNADKLWWRHTPNSQKSLYGEFRNWLKINTNMHTMARYETVSNSVPVIKSWRSLRLEHLTDGVEHKIIIKSDSKGSRYWNVYVSNINKEHFENILNKYSSKYSSYDLWDGRLYEFKTNNNTLIFPDYYKFKKQDSEQNPSVLDAVETDYNKFLNNIKTSWEDNRLDNALASLEQTPNSISAQEDVIRLAIEFDSIAVAINVLEGRLLSQNQWKRNDLERLIQFYQWDGRTNKIWSFLKQRIKKFKTNDTIQMKHYFQSKIGSPPLNDQDWWFQLELEISENKEQVLKNYIKMYSDVEKWSKIKSLTNNYLKQFPNSDSLYFFILQRSFWYDVPASTLELLKKFPTDSYKQLQPLSDNIAKLYAYSAFDYTRAIYWADKGNTITNRTKLEWYLASQRYYDFLSYARKCLNLKPGDDSLRIFIGKSLLSEGFFDKGFELLTPLAEANKIDDRLQKSILNFTERLSLYNRKSKYKKYSIFFSKEDFDNLDYLLRYKFINEVSISGNYQNDNFNNAVNNVKIFWAFGEKNNYLNSIYIGELQVVSQVNSLTKSLQGHQLGYTYSKYFDKGFSQLKFDWKNSFFVSKLLPEYSLTYSTGAFSSFQVGHSTVKTYTALKKSYYQNYLSIYHEDSWKLADIQTSYYLKVGRFTNDIWQYEILNRLSLVGSFKNSFQIQPIAELSYMDASRYLKSAIPFWTPNHQFIAGCGLNGKLKINDISISNELFIKDDFSQGFFFTNLFNLSMIKFSYLQTSLNIYFSTSKVYHSNQISLNLGYFL